MKLKIHIFYILMMALLAQINAIELQNISMKDSNATKPLAEAAQEQEPPVVMASDTEPKMSKVNIPAEDGHYNGVATENLQGRHAYLVHHYGSSESMSNATPPPLYQLLQQQMEQVLAATGADYAVYPSKKYKIKDAGMEVMQIPPKKPQFTYNGEDSDDYADETESELETEDEEEDNIAVASYESAQARPQGVTPPATKRPTMGGKTTSTSPTKAPGKPKTSEALPPMMNATVGPQRRRITFKTVSTSSHFISTPLADLMLKFSIGVARPSNPGNVDYGEPLAMPSTAYQQNGIDAKSAVEKLEASKVDATKQRSPATHAPKHKNVKTRKPKMLDF